MKVTACTACGKGIEYSTRKPLKCVACKAQKKPKTQRKGGRFPRNKGTNAELNMFYMIDQVMIGYSYINHGYYSFLLSPKYSPMQLDRYFPDLKLAFEYDGRQHEEYIKYIHKSKQNFEYYQTCDKLKEKLCRDNGITLIRIAHKQKLTPELIANSLEKANPALYERLLKERRLRVDDYE